MEPFAITVVGTVFVIMSPMILRGIANIIQAWRGEKH